MNKELQKYGFFTTRFVEANNPKDAEDKTMDMLRGEEKLKDIIKNVKNDPPMMYAKEILEIETFDGIDNLKPGFAWYKEKNENS